MVSSLILLSLLALDAHTEYRNGKSISGNAAVPHPDNRSRRNRNHRVLGPGANVHPDYSIFLPLEPVLGFQVTCVVSGLDPPVEYSGVCSGLVCGRSQKKPVEPTPRHRACDLCDGHIPSSVGMAGPQDREQEATIPRSFQTSRELCTAPSLRASFKALTYDQLDPSMDWSCPCYLRTDPDTFRSHAVGVPEVLIYSLFDRRVRSFGSVFRPIIPL